MRPRLALARLIIRLGRFIESLAPALMRPDDLVEFSRQNYSRTGSLAQWCNEEFVNSGLNPAEQDLWAQVPIKQGRVLLLGLGGGREALAFARLGFEVVGVDYIAEMVDKARENAAKQGLQIQALVQEMSRLEVPPHSFDLAVLFSTGLYSFIPTRKRRIAMLQRVGRALKPGGYCICMFMFNPQVSRRATLARKAFAYLTLGNFGFEAGDQIWGSEFLHSFSSVAELKAEFAEAEFMTSYLSVKPELGFYGAVLVKSN